jgi:hypothetical protein
VPGREYPMLHSRPIPDPAQRNLTRDARNVPERSAGGSPCATRPKSLCDCEMQNTPRGWGRRGVACDPAARVNRLSLRCDVERLHRGDDAGQGPSHRPTHGLLPRAARSPVKSRLRARPSATTLAATGRRAGSRSTPRSARRHARRDGCGLSERPGISTNADAGGQVLSRRRVGCVCLDRQPHRRKFKGPFAAGGEVGRGRGRQGGAAETRGQGPTRAPKCAGRAARAQCAGMGRRDAGMGGEGAGRRIPRPA